MSLLTAMVLSLLSVTARAEDPAIYAIIVANNHSFDGKRKPLHFADDDGARYLELFELTAERVELFSVFDEDTQRLFPELVSRTQPPKREAVFAGLERIFAEARLQKAAGRKVIFYFVFSGHGEVGEDREGYVHFLDGPFTRGDLFERVVAASPATVNHVLIDACNAYFLVARRGEQAHPAGDFSGLVHEFLSNESLAAYPNTGVILSTSSAAEVHEWGRIEAGVFSHVLRSALSGAADANRDGAVDYDEAAAYVAAANGALPNRRARLEIFARAPARDLSEPLALVPRRGARVEIPASWAGRYYFEDDRGVRFADFNKTTEVSLDVHLVPRPRYYLRGDEEEFVVEPADDGSLTQVAQIPAAPLTLAMRGSVNDAFDRHLFAIPFGPQFVAGFQQSRFNALTPMVTEIEKSPLTTWRYVSMAVAGSMAATSVTLEVLSRTSASNFRNSAGSEREIAAIRGRAESMHQFALVTGSVALTAVVATVVLYWLED